MNAFGKSKSGSLKTVSPAELLQRSREFARTDVPSEKTLPLAQLVPNPEQPRKHFDETGLRELAESIRQKGLLQPLMVRPVEGDHYEIVFGERRYRASKLAGLTHVPVIVRDLTNQERDFIAAIENLQRRDLSKFEEADAKLRLIAVTLDIPVETVSSKLKSFRARETEHTEEIALLETLFTQLGGEQWKSFVTNKLPVLGLPEPLLSGVRKGDIEYTKAVLISRAPVQEHAALLAQTIGEQWSQEEVQRRVRELKPGKKLSQEAQRLQQVRKFLTPERLAQLDAGKRKKVESLIKDLDKLLS